MNFISLYSYRGDTFFRVRHDLKPHVGDVDAAAVPCGFGRAIGNKVWCVSAIVAHEYHQQKIGDYLKYYFDVNFYGSCPLFYFFIISSL